MCVSYPELKFSIFVQPVDPAALKALKQAIQGVKYWPASILKNCTLAAWTVINRNVLSIDTSIAHFHCYKGITCKSGK
jgi:hypothetical protein